MLIADILQKNAERNPTKEAIIDGNRRVTYTSLLNMSYSLAHELQDQGFSPGDHAAIILPRSIEYVVSYFAILFCGGVVVPIGIELKPTEVYSDLRYCDVSTIITVSQQSRTLVQTLKQGSLPHLKQLMLLYGHEKNLQVPYSKVKYHIPQPSGVKPSQQVPGHVNDLAILLHTSGTTSIPKRVMLSHDNILANVRSNIASLSLTDEDRVLIALPMHFGYCNTSQMLTHLYLGGKLVLMGPRFVPASFWALVQQELITSFTGVPTMLLMLLKQRMSNHYDASSLRYICFGGGPMSEDNLKLLLESFPHIGFVQTYGQTEASPRITALLPEDSLRKLGSIGKPIPGVRVSLVDEQGNSVTPGEVGEIVVNGPNVMLGYYKRKNETDKVLRSEGLFTGDLGYLDKEGYIYLVGRRTNVIISGGVNIYPEEIEECLLGHPLVREAIVVGEAHKMLGEVPIAKIVLHPKTLLSEDEILRFCSERLANYKIPRSIEFRESLSKTYNAKIQRFR